MVFPLITLALPFNRSAKIPTVALLMRVEVGTLIRQFTMLSNEAVFAN